MSTYTKDNNIYFLNDRVISQSLNDDTAKKINSIPSLNLVSALYNNLSAEDKTNKTYASQIELSVAELKAKEQSDVVSLSTDYNTKINDAKTESIQASKQYSNAISAEISAQIDNNRTSDKSEVEGNCKQYSNSISTEISATVKNAGYALFNNFKFEYDSDNHLIKFALKDQNGNTTLSSIDSADFIKDRIVDHVDVVEVEDPQTHETIKALRIHWKSAPGQTVYTDIPIRELAKVYRAGTGIAISPDLSISVTDYVATSQDLASTNSTVNYLSTTIVDGLNTQIAQNGAKILVIQNYVNLLSAKNGLIDQLSDKIGGISTYIDTTIANRFTTNERNITNIATETYLLKGYVDSLSARDGIIDKLNQYDANLSNYIGTTVNARLDSLEQKDLSEEQHLGRLQAYADKLSSKNGLIDQLSDKVGYVSSYITGTIENRLLEDEEDIGTVSSDVGLIKTYVNTLSSKNGVIDTLSDDVDDIYNKIRHNMSYVGHIYINYANIKSKTPQAWVSQHGNKLSSVFKYFDNPESGKVKNGSVYQVVFTNVDDDKTDTNAELQYDTADNFRFQHNDYLIVHVCQEVDTIDISNISPANVYSLQSVRHAQFFQLSTTVRDNFIWLSGGNKIGAEWEIGHANHAISGDNDFLGCNRFDDIVAKSISSNMLSVRSYAFANELSAVKLSVGWSRLFNDNGYTLQDLSSELSDAIVKLSTDLSNEVDTLSAKLCVEIQDLSTSLSTEIDNLSTALSTEIQLLSTSLSNDIDRISATLSSEIQTLSTSLSTDIDSLSTSLSNEIDNLSTNLSTNISGYITGIYACLSSELMVDGEVKSVTNITFDNVVCCMFNLMTFVKSYLSR